MDACDPDADIENLRQLIKLNSGINIKLTKKEICQAYNEIQDGKLPLPPLVMSSDRTYLVDKKSPLKPRDYELLFDSTTKRVDLKRVARKVELKNVEQMTKSQIVEAIGKRLRYMKVHEPVKIARSTQVSVNRNTAVNNTAVNVNNTNFGNNTVNRVNNTVNNYKPSTTNSFVNNTVNRVNNTVNTVNRVNNTVNRVNNTVNRVNNTTTKRNSKLSLPNGGLFAKGFKPKFLGGTQSAIKPPKQGFFAGLFGKKEKKNFNAANKFGGSKPGYVFRTGEKGLGYYENTGAIQGPSLPVTNIKQPIPAIIPRNEDFALDLAVTRIKELGLKREQKFLTKLEVGGVKRKQVVADAERAKEEENNLLTFLDQLNIANTNRKIFANRMATDDFKQIQVEAQIKADEKANVVRSNEEKMNMFLKTTGLGNVNKNSFLSRARQDGSNVNALIEEARRMNSGIRNDRISQKRDEFRQMISNLKLNNADKNGLVNQVDNTTNLTTMKNQANKLVQQRVDEKKNLVAQNLLSFLTPLQINQSNKNDFIRKFRNENANINSIKNEALKLQESKSSDNLRMKLNTQLTELGLNQSNKNSIIKKFVNGNRNVDKLIEEAKALKKQVSNTNLNQSKKEYRAYLNTLQGLTNADKQQLMNDDKLNRNKAKALSNQRTSKRNLNSYMNEIGLSSNNKKNILNRNLSLNEGKALAKETLQKRIAEKREKNMTKLRLHLNGLNLTNDEKRKFYNNLNKNLNLNTIKNTANIFAREKKTQIKSGRLQQLKEFLNVQGLSADEQKPFMNRLNQNKDNINALKVEAKRFADDKSKTIKSIKRLELVEYLGSLKLNNTNINDILKNFDETNTNISVLKGSRKYN